MRYRYSDRYTNGLPERKPVSHQRQSITKKDAAPTKKTSVAPIKKASSPRPDLTPLTPPASPIVRIATPSTTTTTEKMPKRNVMPTSVPNAVTIDGSFQSRLLPCPAMLAPHMKKTSSSFKKKKLASEKSALPNPTPVNNTNNDTVPNFAVNNMPTAVTMESTFMPVTTPLVQTRSIKEVSGKIPTSELSTENSKESSVSKKESGSMNSSKRDSGTKRGTKNATSKRATTTRKRGSSSNGDDGDDNGSPNSMPPKKIRNMAKRSTKRLPILEDTFELRYVIKGHTEDNIPVRSKDELEDSKDNWCCAFEPNVKQLANEKGEFSETAMDTVAICGSYTVLFLDTQQGRYIKKYTHPESQEIFYCLAWTTLTGKQQLVSLKEAKEEDDSNENQQVSEEEEEEDDDGSSCNLLAVAGRLGSIKLLNPLQNECYCYLFGHRKAVLALSFAKAEPRWLLSASADRTVRLWDIGSPRTSGDNSSCLAMFVLPANKGGLPTSVEMSYDMKTVVVGCDNGDMYRFVITAEQLKSFRTRAIEQRKEHPQDGDKWKHLGPIATINAKMRFPGGDEWHEGYVDGVHILGQDGNTRNKMNNLIVSRGSDDMEIIVWNPTKSTTTDGDIHMSLEWPDAAGSSGLRFKVIEQDNQKVLVGGDYEGGLRIYNIGQGKRSKVLDDGSLEQFEPVKVLTHSMSSELMRDVACSSDTRTIVAIDNNNTIFVWASKKLSW
ncbi:WD40-repeat-containing domain protein [Mycotypha africana]|uniref:WD40-repeat-containing domain protein n=1 Tax=Mycotypha africana TaxID=64632 RepID=UPI002301ACFA|nr:WD40-repeat-containing domain protein [Mycotypha africana]KAI8991260.1 WD40-repeat-containing domain protein [Mycotypha africana]